jgi:hypothetical protein
VNADGTPATGADRLRHPLLADLVGSSAWYAVRCIFRSAWPPDEPTTDVRHYEERITLWQAESADDAIALAEVEAEQYAGAIAEAPSEYLGLAQAYALSDPPTHGAEVYSLIRDSSLAPEDYLDAFFDTGTERTGTVTEPPD